MLPIEKATRKSDFGAMLLRNNHKSANLMLNMTALDTEMENELRNGWVMPLTMDAVHPSSISGVIPLRVTKKFSINKKGEMYIKICVTHDCYFTVPSGLSMNNIVLC